MWGGRGAGKKGERGNCGLDVIYERILKKKKVVVGEVSSYLLAKNT